MYSYKEMNGRGYVIHDDTGCSLPYHSKAAKFYDECPDWKIQYFRKWMFDYSNTMRKNVKKMSIANYYPCISFAPLPTPVAVPVSPMVEDCWDNVYDIHGNIVSLKKKQEGNTPMRTYNDTYAVAAITNPKSDESTQRDYLLSRLQSAEYPKREELTKVYNLYANNTPKSYKELIAAIKDGKFTLDAKRTARIDAKIDDQDEDEVFYGGIDPFDGIIWDGPQSDLKGYHSATEKMRKQQVSARDTIMTGDAATGLAALQAFEAWLPETGAKAN